MIRSSFTIFSPETPVDLPSRLKGDGHGGGHVAGFYDYGGGYAYASPSEFHTGNGSLTDPSHYNPYHGALSHLFGPTE